MPIGLWTKCPCLAIKIFCLLEILLVDITKHFFQVTLADVRAEAAFHKSFCASFIVMMVMVMLDLIWFN